MLTFFKRVVVVVLVCVIQIHSEAPDPVRGKNGMVVSASELASKVGVQIMKKGGNAIDAAVAVGFALAVTYPSAGNLGGGGYMVIHTEDGKDIAIDYREKAPLAAHREMYLDNEGEFNIKLSTEGGTSAGVPGSVAGLIYALEKYGTMKLAEVIQPAINLAKDGFPLDYRTTESFKSYMKTFEKYPSSFKVFSQNGRAYEEGEIFKQPDLARTLTFIRDKGRDGFYKGEVAEKFVEQMRVLGGYITFEDLEKYEAAEREPVKGEYRGYGLVSMAPSSSGGLVLMQMLNILENFEFKKEDWGSSRHIHLLSEAMKYAYADRSEHIGDSDFWKVPRNWLTSKDYAKEIAGRIGEEATVSGNIKPGKPIEIKESEETTHYSVYDKSGNAVSVTTTINSTYGSKIVVEGAGFLLNNEMDDFSSKPGSPNQFGLLGGEANAIEPGKRMLSAMTPTIVLKDGKPFIITGSPGGSTIITVVLQVIMNCLDFGMDIQTAINQPRIHHQWFPERIDYEEFGLSADVRENLLKKGQKLGRVVKLGRAEGIMIDNDKKIIYGATDPRGHGGAVGF
jgi:gamma-glutamyltranspeptidase / glutathione hydrolase